MQTRTLGRTSLSVSVLTFGCGAVGGLMTRGAPADQERAVARALEAGVNHFDTAPLYGNGASEENLGRVLTALKPNVIVSTKVRLPAERPDTGAAVAASLDASLKRLKRDHVDVFQLHNVIGAPEGQTLSADEVLGHVVPALVRRLEPMLREGHAASLTEMAVRFAIANAKLSTTEIGLANIAELEGAISAVEKGPLSDGALARLKQLQAQFLGEPR